MKQKLKYLTGWLNNPWIVVAVIVLLSAGLRVAFFLEMRSTPMTRHNNTRETEMRFVEDWSQKLADGNWSTKDGFHPYYSWHSLLAAKHHGETKPAEKYTRDEGRKTWNDWYGGPRYHHEPLYPYTLGILKALGGSQAWMFLLQSLAGILINVLVYLTTRRFFGDIAGIIGGLLAVSFGPFLFYESMLLPTTFMTLSFILALWLAARALEHKQWLAWLPAGAALGLAVMVNSTAILLLPAFVVLAAWQFQDIKQAGRLVGILVGGFLIPILPFIIRNLAVGTPIFQFSSTGAIDFINANAADCQAGTGPYLSIHLVPVLSKSGGAFFASVWETIGTHDGLLGWILLVARNALWSWTPVEVPGDVNFHYYAGFSTVLTYFQIGFGLVASLAVFGLVFALRKVRDNLLLYLFLACALVPLALFLNLSRDRTPLVALIIPFAAYGPVALVEAIRQKAWVWLTAAVIFKLVAAPAVVHAIPDDYRKVRAVDYAAGANAWLTRASEVQLTHDPAAAFAVVARALEAEPAEFREITPTSLPEPTRRNVSMARSFGRIYAAGAHFAEQAGDLSAANHFYGKAVLLETLLKAAPEHKPKDR